MEKLSPNATKVAPGKVSPVSYSCSYAGFPLKETKWQIKVNQKVVKAEMAYLRDHMMIVSFVRERQSPLLTASFF
jgi:hypothetical protein